MEIPFDLNVNSALRNRKEGLPGLNLSLSFRWLDSLKKMGFSRSPKLLLFVHRNCCYKLLLFVHHRFQSSFDKFAIYPESFVLVRERRKLSWARLKTKISSLLIIHLSSMICFYRELSSILSANSEENVSDSRVSVWFYLMASKFTIYYFFKCFMNNLEILVSIYFKGWKFKGRIHPPQMKHSI